MLVFCRLDLIGVVLPALVFSLCICVINLIIISTLLCFSSFLLFCLRSKVYTLLWINSWQRWVGLWLLLTFQNGEYKTEAIWLIPNTNHLMHSQRTCRTALKRAKSDFHTTVSRTQKTRMAKFYPISVLYRTMRLLIFIMVRAIKWWKKLHLSTH